MKGGRYSGALSQWIHKLALSACPGVRPAVTVMVEAFMAADLGITVIAEGIESANVAREPRPPIGIPWGRAIISGGR